MRRTLTITSGVPWQTALRAAGAHAKQAVDTGKYQGETLNFESSAEFFGRLTELRWQMIRAMLGSGVVGVRELARRLDRGVKRVHEDAQVLVALGIFEKTSSGALCCPFDDIHVDMHLTPLTETA